MMKYAGYCEHPLNDVGVLVEANNRAEAADKIRQGVALVAGCKPEEVEYYNLNSEEEEPNTVLHYQTAWGGKHGVGENRAAGWMTDPLILFGDKERGPALQRWAEAMRLKATYDARKSSGHSGPVST